MVVVQPLYPEYDLLVVQVERTRFGGKREIDVVLLAEGITQSAGVTEVMTKLETKGIVHRVWSRSGEVGAISIPGQIPAGVIQVGIDAVRCRPGRVQGRG